MKQTAVERLELSLLGIISFDSEELRAKYKQRVLEAKENEKKQIIDANIAGMEFIAVDINHYNHDAEQYFVENFSNNEAQED